ncbi:MAG: FAD-binding protein [Thermoanaerobaculia bacterium]
MLNRRELLKLAALLPAACVSTARDEGRDGEWVNDIHSQLNRTWVAGVRRPASTEELQALIRSTRGAVCTAGGRHAMGGQQFATDATLVDMNGMRRVLAFDRDRGIIDVEAGIQWPELIAATRDSRWAIRQKQTGADRLSIGGALSANAHGRGLTMKPFVGDVESFTLIDANGGAHECSRARNGDLFAHAIGGYGLFGIVSSVRLRLAPRRKVQRVVEEQEIDTLLRAFDARIADGFLYGDFQFSIDAASTEFLRRGVFSCYRAVPDDTPLPAAQAELRPEDWMRLLVLAHANKSEAYQRYAAYYLSTNGQVYASDEHQLGFYPDDYHRALDPLLRSARATEMITELYVPREKLADFMSAAGEEIRRRNASIIYGTVRLIEQDEETTLAWAKQRYACVIFNLHTEHDEASLAKTSDAFRALIDLALARGGSYFLTYHRWARREQVEAAYPRFRSFLAEKKRVDPRARFASDWIRHYA